MYATHCPNASPKLIRGYSRQSRPKRKADGRPTCPGVGAGPLMHKLAQVLDHPEARALVRAYRSNAPGLVLNLHGALRHSVWETFRSLSLNVPLNAETVGGTVSGNKTMWQVVAMRPPDRQIGELSARQSQGRLRILHPGGCRTSSATTESRKLLPHSLHSRRGERRKKQLTKHSQRSRRSPNRSLLRGRPGRPPLFRTMRITREALRGVNALSTKREVRLCLASRTRW